MYVSHYSSPLGTLTLASDGVALAGLWIEGQKYDASLLDGREMLYDDIPVFAQTREWLDTYFSGVDPGAPPPLALSGSDFRKMVGEVMLTIPYGHTMTYGQIASAIAAMTGREKVSARAVGGAVGHNPISIIVPCHRVIGSNGSLTGYAGGIEKKIALLRLEGIIV